MFAQPHPFEVEDNRPNGNRYLVLEETAEAAKQLVADLYKVPMEFLGAVPTVGEPIWRIG